MLKPLTCPEQVAADLRNKIQAKIDAAMSDDEKFLLNYVISNRGFHYWGSAKFFAQIGKAFADALVELRK